MESGGTWRRTPCDQVISRVDRDENLGSGRLLDISLVAKQLGTSVMWVERCMLAYGRRPARASVEKSTDQRLENLEEQEPEEIGAEEEDATGEKPERPERPKTLHNSQRPAPEPGEGQPQP